jgi:cell division septation protein DedD
MNNERGGILSKIIIIPTGVVLMAGFFFLGYYVGRYQNKSGGSGEIAQPLPEIASSSGQKQEEFTFYKTLTDKTDRTVSIDLKPKPVKPVKEENKPVKQQITAEAPKSISISAAPRQPPLPAKREPAAASSSTKLRYTVQTASYQERDMAEDEVKRLKKRGFAAFIVSSELTGKGVWHRVRLGSFSNKAAAERLQKSVREKEGLSTIVVLE